MGNLDGCVSEGLAGISSDRTLFKNTLAVVFVCLVFGLGITGVPNSGHSGPAVLRVPQDYATIQSAVSAAGSGDSVLVSGGIYSESVTIDKSLNLTGVSRDTTIIDPQENGPGINITRTNGVFISGFTIRGAGLFYDAVDIYSSSSVTLAWSRIEASNQTSGLFISNSSSVAVRNNDIFGSEFGINLQGGFDNVLRDNNVTLNSLAIGIGNSRGNVVKDNRLGVGLSGLELVNSIGNVVARNRVFNNTGTGVFLWNSTSNRFFENNIEFNMGQTSSIGVRFQNSTGNQFYYNNMRNNTIQVFGVFIPGDISLNTWNDAGASPRGNFWSDYAGLDDGSNARVAGDGVGDTAIPHPCPLGGRPCSTTGPAGVDNYPLTSPWSAPSLTVTGSVDRSNGYPPLIVSFTALVSGGSSPYSFKWEFGNGDSSNLQNVTYTYRTVGSYVARLTVTDDTQAQRSDLVAITVLAVPPPTQPPKTGDILPLVLAVGGISSAAVVLAVVILAWRKRRGGSQGPSAKPRS